MRRENHAGQQTRTLVFAIHFSSFSTKFSDAELMQ